MALQNAIFQRKGIFSLILVNVMMFIGMIQGIGEPYYVRNSFRLTSS